MDDDGVEVEGREEGEEFGESGKQFQEQEGGNGGGEELMEERDDNGEEAEAASLEAGAEQETRADGSIGDSRFEADALQGREGGDSGADRGVGIDDTSMSALQMSDLSPPSKPSKESILDKHKRERKEIYSSPPSRPSTTPARPHTVAGGPRPKTGSSVKSLMVWRSQSGVGAVGKRSHTADADKRREWGNAKRRNWLSEVPLSTKPNPPRIKWPMADRPFQRDAEQDQRIGVSSCGLSWEMKTALRATARLPSPSFWFGTTERTGALTAPQAKQARETPAPGKYPLENTLRNGRAKTPGGSFTHGIRTQVNVYQGRGGGAVSTLGTYDVIDESGIQYSSMGKQAMARMKTQPRCSFGQAPRRSMAQPSGAPGPADYAIVSRTGDKGDHAYRTKSKTAPEWEVPRTKRPWQTLPMDHTVPCTMGTIPPLGLTKQPLARIPTAPRATFGTSDRMPKPAFHTPGPGSYSS